MAHKAHPREAASTSSHGLRPAISRLKARAQRGPEARVGAMAKVYLDPGEVALLEQEATSVRDRLLIRLLSHLGCRISESLALTVEDTDFYQGTVVIQHLKARLKLACPYCNTRPGEKRRRNTAGLASQAATPQSGGLLP